MRRDVTGKRNSQLKLNSQLATKLATVNRQLPTTVALSLVFVVALAFRLVAVSQLGDLPLSRTPQLDSAEYLTWARAIADGSATWPLYPEHAPGYPFFLAGLLKIFGSLTAVRVAQSVLGAAACVMTMRVTAQVFGARAAVAAGLLQAAYGPLIYLDTAILAEPLLIFLLTCSLALVMTADDKPVRWLFTGLSLGAAAIVRPTALVIAFVFFVAAVTRSPRRDRTRVAAAFVTGLLLLTLPVIIQNWRVSGLPIIQAYGGMNVYLGNRPSGDGAARARPGGEWDRLEGEASRASATGADADRYYLRKTMNEIGDRPAAYVQLLGSKLLWTISNEELRDTHSYYFFADAMPVLHWLPSFGWIFALAIVGATATASPSKPWLTMYVIATGATVILLVVGTRYRAPMVPAVIACAGAGLMTLVDRARSRDWRGLAAIVAVGLLALGVSMVRRDPASNDFSEEWAFNGLSLLQERQIEASEAAYRKSIALRDSSFGWDGLGLVLQRRQLYLEAREAFERALQINPENATAWLHLGLAFEYLGNPRRAVDAYAKAVAIVPARQDARDVYESAMRRYAR